MADISTPLSATNAAIVDSTDPVRREHAIGSRVRQLEQLVLEGSAPHTADTDMGGFKVTDLGTPTADTDAATKAYVDAAAIGADWKPSVRVATAAALPAYTRVGNVLTGNANGALAAVDGVTLVVGNRLLVKNGAAGADNGIYVVTTVGDGSNPFVLTRATDADTSAEVTSGVLVAVSEGTANASTVWMLTTSDAITLNTTALTFTQVGGDINALLAYRAKLVVTHDATPAGTAAAVNVALDRVSGLGYFVSTTSADADNGGSATVVDGAGTTVGGAVDGISLTDSDSPPGVPVYVNAGVLKADLSTLNGGATSVFVRTAHGRLLEVAHSAAPATGGDPLLWDDQAAVGEKLVATLTDNGAADVNLFTSTDIAAGHKLTP